ncbi:acyltransferase-domain-containing protein [Fimicolochytrium jonesii]|uniref:acyltransferase-domain-containing protein n=1 Tax=Fimicolochytrium jonesii TaxID=1396493 RepID=UPI0022FE9AD7|nr:acyltransferase-domain-containing protein [Fimicolochytrium jonesii]KAI8816288.1 acyltransferase-domain-containing protein [Fimicolochytrium jonesii]
MTALTLAPPKRSVTESLELMTMLWPPQPGGVGLLAKGFMRVYLKTHTFNEDRLFRTVLEKTDRPLITVANHASMCDDPGMWGVLPWSILTHKHRMRWSMGAKEICFTTPLTSWFFASGQVIPTVRGDGIYQPAVNKAIEKLNDNAWIHVSTPSGKINQESTDLLPFRWGVARLIMESKVPPLFIPIWHKGFVDVMPEATDFYFPRPRAEVVLAYGEPIDFAANGVLDHARSLPDPKAARIYLTEQVFKSTVALQRATEKRLGDPHWRHAKDPQRDAKPPRWGDPS